MLRGGVIVALTAICAVWGGAVHAMSLQEAVEQSVRTNPKIDAATANLRASQYVLRQAKGRFLPELDVNADVGMQRIDRPNGLGPLVNDRWNNRRQVTLSVRQVLFDGWDRLNDLYRSRAQISAASFKVLARSEAVGLASVEAYIDVVRHDQLLALSVGNVQRHQALLRIIRDRFQGGRSPVGDVEQTVERLEAAKSLLAQIRISRETAVAKFKGLVGVPPSKLAVVPYAQGVPATSAEVVNQAVRHNPLAKAALADIDVAHFERKQFSSTLLPQVYLEGSATRGEYLEGTPGRNNELEAKVVLNWKLLDGSVRRNRQFELDEREYEKWAEQLAMIRQLTEQSETAWARYSEGLAEVESLKRQVAQNIKVVKTYRDEYNADRRSLLDVLDAENSRFGSEFELSNAASLHLFSSYELLAHMGVLLATLNVEPPPLDEVSTNFLPGVLGIRGGRRPTIPPLNPD